MDLCISCGLCCSGVIFSYLKVEPAERERPAVRRLPLHDDGRLDLPCPVFEQRCTIYDERPQICADYACDVLIALEAGTTTPEEASALVTRTRALALSVRARVPGTGHLWTDIAAFAQDSDAWRRAHAELLVDIALLRRLLSRFRGDDVKPGG